MYSRSKTPARGGPAKRAIMAWTWLQVRSSGFSTMMPSPPRPGSSLRQPRSWISRSLESAELSSRRGMRGNRGGCLRSSTGPSAAPRNLIAANMFMRRTAFVELGGFRAGFGKTGARSGTEETDLCIRASQRWPEGVWLYDPAVAVSHRVPQGRSRLSYFVARCYDEGVAKASIVEFVGGQDGLASERVYTTQVLPRGFIRGLKAASFGGDVAGIARSFLIVVGLAATVAGYLFGKLTMRQADEPTDDPTAGTTPND
jgi:hypothetical protein